MVDRPARGDQPPGAALGRRARPRRCEPIGADRGSDRPRRSRTPASVCVRSRRGDISRSGDRAARRRFEARRRPLRVEGRRDARRSGMAGPGWCPSPRRISDLPLGPRDVPSRGPPARRGGTCPGDTLRSDSSRWPSRRSRRPAEHRHRRDARPGLECSHDAPGRPGRAPREGVRSTVLVSPKRGARRSAKGRGAGGRSWRRSDGGRSLRHAARPVVPRRACVGRAIDDRSDRDEVERRPAPSGARRRPRRRERAVR